MPLMPDAATGENHWQVTIRMVRSIAHAAADHHQRAVHQLRYLQLPEQVRELRHQILLHDLQLAQQALLLAITPEVRVPVPSPLKSEEKLAERPYEGGPRRQRAFKTPSPWPCSFSWFFWQVRGASPGFVRRSESA